MEETSSDEIHEAAWLQAMELCTLCLLPMAVRAAIALNVFEILDKDRAHSALSAEEIVTRLATLNPQAPITLDRILRILASHSILCSSLEVGSRGEFVRKYRLTPLSNYMLQEHVKGSLAPFLLLHSEPKTLNTLYRLHESVLEGGGLYPRIMGKDLFLTSKEDDEILSNLFFSAMTHQSKAFSQRFLDVYDGFHGLNSLLDVGGGSGACLSMIVARHPHIRGINFDLPHVIATSPAYPGVQHVEGDMFESVPPVEAVFMKLILHDWNDERCIKVLQNCHRALPENGKVIVADAILPVAVETGPRARVGYHMDMVLLAFTSGGKERTEEEFKYLVKAAGFSGMKVMCTVNELSVMEFYKS